MTIQEQIKQTLENSGIPAKEIKCYGSQIMITAWSHGAASKMGYPSLQVCDGQEHGENA